MSDVFDAPERRALPMLIAFTDLTRFTKRALRTPDHELAESIDDFYQRVSEVVSSGGGRVVKFIGDAALIVFPADRVDDGVVALLELKRDIDAWLDDVDWDSRMIVKVHFGTVVAGHYGTEGDRRFDIIGKDVNATARLDSRGFAISVDAFRKLSSETRKRFKKHTPPITYIRVEDQHPNHMVRG
jgi:class 3 adenylate cyclase